MRSNNKVKLGDQVFTLSSAGEVVRTIVGKISKGDRYNNFELRYELLDGVSGRHWFSYEEASAASVEQVQRKMGLLKKQLASLRKKAKYLGTEEAKHAAMNASYKVTDLRGLDDRQRTRKIKHVAVPDVYPNINDVRYLVITPQVRSVGVSYCPCKHFVLETLIHSVCFGSDGTLHSGFATPFRPEECFVSREEAESKLRSILNLDEKEPVYFVSHEAELQELAKIEDIPF